MSKIVVVESIANRSALAELAGSLDDGPTVVSFTETEAALAWADRAVPDLVIAGHDPPAIDAVDLTERLRAQRAGFDIAVIVVASRDDRRLRYRALDAGASDLLVAPLDHVELRARARNLLALRKHQQILKDGLSTLE